MPFKSSKHRVGDLPWLRRVLFRRSPPPAHFLSICCRLFLLNDPPMELSASLNINISIKVGFPYDDISTLVFFFYFHILDTVCQARSNKALSIALWVVPVLCTVFFVTVSFSALYVSTSSLKAFGDVSCPGLVSLPRRISWPRNLYEWLWHI